MKSIKISEIEELNTILNLSIDLTDKKELKIKKGVNSKLDSFLHLYDNIEVILEEEFQKYY